MSGNVVLKRHFGGSSGDTYNSVTAVPGGIIAAGYSYSGSFTTGDWTGVAGKGGEDAIIVNYFNTNPVTNITNVPATVAAGMPLTLAGTVIPSNASRQTIVWSIADAGTTYPTLSGNILTATATGTVKVRATITDGIATGTNYVQDFNISVTFVPVTSIVNIPTTATKSTMLTLTGTVEPSNASYKNIVWTLLSDGGTNAVVSGNTFFASSEGIAFLKASIVNGTAVGVDFEHTFTVTVSTVGIVEGQVSNLPVQVYPNPTTGQLVIEMSEIGNRTSEIQIYDIVGKLLQSKIVNLQSEIILDISHLANGMYYLKIEDRVVKIVKN